MRMKDLLVDLSEEYGIPVELAAQIAETMNVQDFSGDIKEQFRKQFNLYKSIRRGK